MLFVLPSVQGLRDNALQQLRRGNMTWESTEKMYIGGLKQASLKEVKHGKQRPARKSGDFLTKLRAASNVH